MSSLVWICHQLTSNHNQWVWYDVIEWNLLNGLAKKDLKRMQKLPNKCARLICQIPRSDHIRPSLDQPHWLPILACVIYKTVLHVFFFKSLHWLSLLYIDSCLKIRSLLSSVTRSSNYIFLEVPRSKKLAFCVSAPKVWNNLPNTIKDASGLDTFKTQLKWYSYPYYHVLSNFVLFCLHFLVFIFILFNFFVSYFALCMHP